MAKKSMILKQQAPAKFSTRKYNRCKLCGRPHAYLRDYGVCRICFRTLAYKGRDPRCPQGFLVIFFRHTSLARLDVHKLRRRLAASSGEKILDLSHAVPVWLAVRKVQRHPAASHDERVHSVIYCRWEGRTSAAALPVGREPCGRSYLPAKQVPKSAVRSGDKGWRKVTGN